MDGRKSTLARWSRVRPRPGPFPATGSRRTTTSEDRLLRRPVNAHVGAALGWRSSAGEDTALDWVIDPMAQQAMAAFVTSDGELIRLALQNLISNATKYGGRGTARVGA